MEVTLSLASIDISDIDDIAEIKSCFFLAKSAPLDTVVIYSLRSNLYAKIVCDLLHILFSFGRT